MYSIFSLILNLFMLVAVPQYDEVRSAPMTKPDHARRWYNQMIEQWPDQLDHLTMGTRADGTPKATPNGLIWKGLSITSSEVMPFCEVGTRLYLIALPGFRTFHVMVDTTEYELRVNAPIGLGGKSILVFDEKVARIAFPIHGRMVYGHRIGELFTDADDNVWEEVWRNAKQIHEEKETRMHSNSNQRNEQRIDHYYMRCSIGEITADMVANANGSTIVEVPKDGKKGKKGKTQKMLVQNEDPREQWDFFFTIFPYEKKEDEPEQRHFYYMAVSFIASNIQLVANGEVVAESSNDKEPLYVPIETLYNKELKLFLSPGETGDVDLKSMRLVECVHELVQ